MELMCPVCGEPWDVDSLHDMGGWIDEEVSFEKARRRFAKEGCAAFGEEHGEGVADPAIAAIYELSDDVDGWASDLEDFGLL